MGNSTAKLPDSTLDPNATFEEKESKYQELINIQLTYEKNRRLVNDLLDNNPEISKYLKLDNIYKVFTLILELNPTINQWLIVNAISDKNYSRYGYRK